MYNENEKPLGMSDDEWENLMKQSFFQQCPEEVKNAMREQGIEMTDEEHDQIWQEMPKYFAHLRKQHKEKKFATMYTPDGLKKVTQCVNIIKTISKLIDEEVKIELLPVHTILTMNKTASQIINVNINEIKFGKDIVDGKCGTLLSQLNEIADMIDLTVARNGEDISMHIYIKDAVIVKEI